MNKAQMVKKCFGLNSHTDTYIHKQKRLQNPICCCAVDRLIKQNYFYERYCCGNSDRWVTGVKETCYVIHERLA